MGFDFGRAAAGFAVGMGDTFLANIQAERKDALEWAATQRKTQLAEDVAIRAEDRALKNKRGEMNKEFKVDGQYVTEQELLDAQAANKESAPARQQAREDMALREQEGFDTIKAEGNLLRTKDINDVRDYGAPTEKEKGLIHSEKKISKVSDEVLALKQAHDTDKFRAKIETELKVLEAKQTASAAQLERKAELQFMLEAMKIRERNERSDSKSAEKLSPDQKRLQDLDDLEGQQNGGLTEAQTAQRESLRKKLGVTLTSAPSEDKVATARAQAKKEASKKAGFLTSDKKDFAEDGGSRDAFIERRTQEILSGGGSPQPDPKPAAVKPAPAQNQRPTTSLPAVGTIKNGYKFKGGDPSKQQNWVRVGG
jgi:hypothetical protein